MLPLACLRISILVLCGLQLVSMYQYEVEFQNSEIFSPCDDYPDNWIDSVADISNLDIGMNEDGTVDIKGQFKLTHDFKKPQYKGSVEIFKRDRGTWQKTIYSVKRNDFCNAVFSMKELWTPYFINVPMEERKCPLAKGNIYNFNMTTQSVIEVSDRNLAGEYNMHVEGGDLADGAFVCINIFINLYRH